MEARRTQLIQFSWASGDPQQKNPNFRSQHIFPSIIITVIMQRQEGANNNEQFGTIQSTFISFRFYRCLTVISGLKEHIRSQQHIEKT